MNFYKHHIGDYAQATSHLSFVEDAAYSRLLRKYYAEEKPIPGDLKAAARLISARTEEEKEAVEVVLEEFFKFDPDENVWRNKRADEEIAKASAQAETNRRIAEERESKRRERMSNQASTNRLQIQHESFNESFNDHSTKGQPSQTPDSRQEQRSTSLERQAARKTAERFPEFWMVYPVKKGKAEAEGKWRAKGYDAIADTIIEDVKRRVSSDRQWLDGYAPHGSTYINSQGWLDEIEPMKGLNGSGSHIFGSAI